MIISYGLKRNYTIHKLLAVSTVTVMLSTVLLYLSASVMMQGEGVSFKNLQEAFVHKLEATKQEIIASFKDTKNMTTVEIENLQAFENNLNYIINKVRNIHHYFAVMLLWASVFSVWITYVSAQIVFRKMNISLPELPPFEFFNVPWQCIWGLILSGILVNLNFSTLITLIGENVLYTFMILYFLTGLSIAKYYLIKMTLPVIFKGFLFIILLLLLQNILFFIGLIDNMLDFRNIRGHDLSSIKLYGQKRDMSEI